MSQLVKYKSKDGKYDNFGIKTASGFIIPIKPLIAKHYYSLLDIASEINVEYK